MFEFIKWFFSSPEPERPTDKVDIALIEKAFSVLRGGDGWEREEIGFMQTDYDDFFSYERWEGPVYGKGDGSFFVGVASRAAGTNEGKVYIAAPNCCRILYCPELAEAVKRVRTEMEEFEREALVGDIASL